MIDVLMQVTKFIENDKEGVVLDSFMQQMIDLLENYGEKASHNFWVELLKIISYSTMKGDEYPEEIYAKSKSLFSTSLTLISLQACTIHQQSSCQASELGKSQPLHRNC